jgi:hypothetical protein
VGKCVYPAGIVSSVSWHVAHTDTKQERSSNVVSAFHTNRGKQRFTLQYTLSGISLRSSSEAHTGLRRFVAISCSYSVIVHTQAPRRRNPLFLLSPPDLSAISSAIVQADALVVRAQARVVRVHAHLRRPSHLSDGRPPNGAMGRASLRSRSYNSRLHVS